MQHGDSQALKHKQSVEMSAVHKPLDHSIINSTSRRFTGRSMGLHHRGENCITSLCLKLAATLLL